MGKMLVYVNCVKNPYSNLPPSKFWKTGVSGRTADNLQDLYQKRYAITPSTRVAAAGSCFAQHIVARLRTCGHHIVDCEPPPPRISTAQAQRFGYLLFSARHGNIYTARQLLQLTQECLGIRQSNEIWERQGRYFDPLRPSIEPEGFDSPEEVRAHRESHLRRFREVLETAEVFVFTFGLSEAWTLLSNGTVYPVAPGVVAGAHDPNRHGLVSFGFKDVYSDFIAFRDLTRQINPEIRFLLTVSPVPLTATAGDEHVLVATIKAKSILRAVTAQLYDDFEDVDYFPSYEIVGTPFFGSSFYEANMRSVSRAGVDTVMNHFFFAHGVVSPTASPQRAPTPHRDKAISGQDPICEEALMEAFASEPLEGKSDLPEGNL